MSQAASPPKFSPFVKIRHTPVSRYSSTFPPRSRPSQLRSKNHHPAQCTNRLYCKPLTAYMPRKQLNIGPEQSVNPSQCSLPEEHLPLSLGYLMEKSHQIAIWWSRSVPHPLLDVTVYLPSHQKQQVHAPSQLVRSATCVSASTISSRDGLFYLIDTCITKNLLHLADEEHVT